MDEPDFTGLAAARVGVVGLGLMGGSMALALRGYCREIIGVDPEPQSQALARANNVVDRVAGFDEAARSDLLILAAPVRAILSHLAQLASLPDPSGRVVVLDLGSTKAEIAAAMEALPPGYDPLGGHPMCGKEVSGLEHAEAALFRDKVFVLTPLARTSPAGVALAQAVAGVAGARPWVLTPEVHDRLAAVASHLPYVVATLLVAAAQATGDDHVWRMTASGFRDTSRLAASDVTMMIDILLTNRAPVLEALAQYRAELDELRTMLSQAETDRLRALLSRVRAERRARFP